jgi:hypothetical protein
VPLRPYLSRSLPVENGTARLIARAGQSASLDAGQDQQGDYPRYPALDLLTTTRSEADLFSVQQQGTDEASGMVSGISIED